MKERRTVLVLFVAALVFRVVVCLIFANDIIPGSDQMQEIMLGRNLANGDLYGVLDTYWAPLYPILIGIVSLVIDSPVIPAALVSILAGSLVVPLTYILALQSYERRVALVAGTLAIFFPHLINSVLTLGSENVYVILLISALIVAWNAVKRNSMIQHLATGVILGLAYLTRPEAIGYPIYFVLITLVHNYRYKRSFAKESMPQATVLLLGFLLFAAPYLLYLRSETGRWTLSGKTEINSLLAKVGDSPEREQIAESATPKSVRIFVKYFLINLTEFHKAFPSLLPPALLLLLGLGLFRDGWGNSRREREIYLLLFCVVTLAGYAAAVVQLRYFYVLLPVLFGWIACGIVNFSVWVTHTFKRGGGTIENGTPGSNVVIALVLVAIYLYLLPLNLYTSSTERLWETGGYEEREAGLWLKKNVTPNSLIFSASRRPAFYSGARQLPPKTSDLDENVATIKHQKADYVVTSERSLKRNPYLKDLAETLRNDPEFDLVYEFDRKEGYGVRIFKRRKSPSEESSAVPDY